MKEKRVTNKTDNRRERSFEQLLDTAEIKDFFFRAERDMFPKLESSAMVTTIFDGKVDCKLALEIGAAVLLDKPILLIALKGARIPENLRRCARAIVEIDSLQNPESKRKVLEAVEACAQAS